MLLCSISCYLCVKYPPVISNTITTNASGKLFVVIPIIPPPIPIKINPIMYFFDMLFIPTVR